MKSTKKRVKKALKTVRQSAKQLQLLASELEELSAVHQIATTTLKACDALAEKTLELSKADFHLRLAEINAMTELEALTSLTDSDITSEVESRLLTLTDNDADCPAGEFFQRLLAKIDGHSLIMLQNVSRLTALVTKAQQSSSA